MNITLNDKSARYLENNLCVKLGFCSMGEKYDAIIEDLPIDLSDFVNRVFLAEGLNPEYADRRLWRSVRDYVLHYYHNAVNDHN